MVESTDIFCCDFCSYYSGVEMYQYFIQHIFKHFLQVSK